MHSLNLPQLGLDAQLYACDPVIRRPFERIRIHDVHAEARVNGVAEFFSHIHRGDIMRQQMGDADLFQRFEAGIDFLFIAEGRAGHFDPDRTAFSE